MAEKARCNRRVLGMLKKRLAEARLDEVPDPRDRRGRRWPLGTLLRSAVVGLVSGAKSLGDVERTTAELTPAVRRRLGIRRRVSDTTLRDLLCKLRPHEVRPHLHRVVRAAHRRKALSDACGLPFGRVSLDGKATAVPSSDDFYAQRQSNEAGVLTGVVRTVTATLTSHPARPCVDVTTIPASTNEMGAFEAALRGLVAAYDGIDLFRLSATTRALARSIMPAWCGSSACTTSSVSSRHSRRSGAKPTSCSAVSAPSRPPLLQRTSNGAAALSAAST